MQRDGRICKQNIKHFLRTFKQNNREFFWGENHYLFHKDLLSPYSENLLEKASFFNPYYTKSLNIKNLIMLNCSCWYVLVHGYHTQLGLLNKGNVIKTLPEKKCLIISITYTIKGEAYKNLFKNTNII